MPYPCHNATEIGITGQHWWNQITPLSWSFSKRRRSQSCPNRFPKLRTRVRFPSPAPLVCGVARECSGRLRPNRPLASASCEHRRDDERATAIAPPETVKTAKDHPESESTFTSGAEPAGGKRMTAVAVRSVRPLCNTMDVRHGPSGTSRSCRASRSFTQLSGHQWMQMVTV